MDSWQKFKKKPVVIVAFKFDMEEARKIALDYFKHHHANKFKELVSTQFDFDIQGCPLIAWFNGTTIMKHFEIETREGNHEISEGDWIIKGVAGEFYPVKSKIFAKTYETVI